MFWLKAQRINFFIEKKISMYLIRELNASQSQILKLVEHLAPEWDNIFVSKTTTREAKFANFTEVMKRTSDLFYTKYFDFLLKHSSWYTPLLNRRFHFFSPASVKNTALSKKYDEYL